MKTMGKEKKGYSSRPSHQKAASGNPKLNSKRITSQKEEKHFLTLCEVHYEFNYCHNENINTCKFTKYYSK